jgi:hypothetical protein
MLIKPRRLVLSVSFAAIGAIYFVAFTGLDVHPILKQQLVLLPVQLGVLIYLLWGRKQSKSSDKELDNAPNP